MTTKVLYHANCLDGFAAAYAAWSSKLDKDTDTLVEYIPVQYSEPPPDVTDCDVYILDFSYPREVIVEMHRVAKSLIVLDHHKTAMKDLEGLPYAVFDMELSGGMMAWHYFHPGKIPPKLFTRIQDRDLWQFKFKDTKAITTALYEAIDRDFLTWTLLIDSEEALSKLEYIGDILVKIHTADVAKLLKKAGSICLAEQTGLFCTAMPKYSLELGNELAKLSGTFGCTAYYDGAGKQWIYSLRSIGEYDCSVIAKHYGGGGHRNASGFTSPHCLI
jgi:nanoRNase/pAp phosphatase (c-di-AMP/oligoRNAs hydrolase)